jgi:hypothetical protein
LPGSCRIQLSVQGAEEGAGAEIAGCGISENFPSSFHHSIVPKSFFFKFAHIAHMIEKTDQEVDYFSYYSETVQIS